VTHVDDFIDDYTQDKYARFVLNFFRMSTVLQMDFEQWTKGYWLYCTWRGGRYRVVGASRLGDVWLKHPGSWSATDAPQMAGFYDHRVDVAECSAWSSTDTGVATLILDGVRKATAEAKRQRKAAKRKAVKP